MVATERVKRAETEEELQEVRLEKDALKEALRLIESQSDQLRSTQLSTGRVLNRPVQRPSSHSRSDAIKLPPPSPSPSPSNPNDISVPLALPPSAASFTAENPDHLADFLLQPAPKATFTTLHPKPPHKEKVISDALGNPPPLAAEFASQTTISFIPNEPSPWADVSP